MTPAFELIFDLNGSLHEVVITKRIESNLPIMVDDHIADLYAKFGDSQCPWVAYTSIYFEYALDSYYLRVVCCEEQAPFDETLINEIIISKYSTEQYREIRDPATLILTNQSGDKADFFIGMSVDEVKAKLDILGIGYYISNNGVMTGDSYDYLPDEAPPDGYSFEIHFDINRCIHTLAIYGPGAMTEQGLQNGDPEERRVELYGNDYNKILIQDKYWNEYNYICGDNYLNISTECINDSSVIISVLEITRFTENSLKANSFYGVE